MADKPLTNNQKAEQGQIPPHRITVDAKVTRPTQDKKEGKD